MDACTATDLTHAQVFRHLPAEARSRLASHFEVVEAARGEALFEAGQDRQALFLVLQGEVELVDPGAGRFERVAIAGPGTVLGEAVWLEHGAHNLTCRAAGEARLARLARAMVDHLRQTDPELFVEVVLRVSQLLTRRMANASRGQRGIGSALRPGRYRVEHDLLGDREVPEDVLWGVQTLRAIENFDISRVRLDHFPELIEALARIKRACAVVNRDLGQLDEARCAAIVGACDELVNGLWHGHFVVDAVQGGAGTSTNMNANEVIANRALELMGRERGDYGALHPNNHVNMSQSTNDVYPSAIKLALLHTTRDLLDEVERLADSFGRKGEAFAHVLKMGRTQLQDAVPMTLGQEFTAWSRTLREGGARVAQARASLSSLNLGGTAIGTGINTDPRYARLVVEELARDSGLDLRLAPDLIEETQDTSSFVELAGVLKMLAVRLSKICNDLRLLSSGPRCGLNEIDLPAVQPGSSIMPGKVNPVIPEVVNQVAFQVIGLDVTVALAAEGGQLELNVFEPLIAYDLLTSVHMMRRAMETLRKRCVDGITANEEVCRRMVHSSIGVVTALVPHIGYERASEVASEALRTGRAVAELVLERGYLDREELDRLLSPAAMIRPTLG